MVNHQAVRNFPSAAQAVNGHQPMIWFNVTTGHARIYCETCDWSGRGSARRWHEHVETQWREHAGDIAMGRKITHGEANNGCHCASCGRATRLAAEASTPPDTEETP